jgi:hypothetical protein
VKVVALLALAALAAGAPVLSAQTVVQPEPKLNDAQLTVRNSLYQLRDTLQLVEAASARIARDLRSASDAALRSRARTMADRCRAATVQVDSTRTVVERGKLPDPDPRSARLSLDKALEVLRGHLVDCTAQFTALTSPEKAEELRGYGIGRGQRVQAAIQTYRPTASQYFRTTFQQQYWPSTRGAGATPSTPSPR